MELAVGHAPVIIKVVLAVPQQFVCFFLYCLKAFVPQLLFFLFTDYSGNFGKAVHIVCKESRKVHTVHFLRLIETRGIIHSRFAAAAQRIVIHLPFGQTVAVNIAVIYIPLQIFTEGLKNLLKKLFVAAGFIDLQRSPTECGRLRHGGLPRRHYHMRQKSVLMLKLKHSLNALLGKVGTYVLHTHGMICRIPQPHRLVRKAVGGSPQIAYLLFGGVNHRTHYGETLVIKHFFGNVLKLRTRKFFKEVVSCLLYLFNIGVKSAVDKRFRIISE